MPSRAAVGNNFILGKNVTRKFQRIGGLSLTQFFCLKKSAEVSGTF
jgi:hypothetical protein